MFHHLEALLLQEAELLRHQTARAVSFPRFGAHQSKRIEPHIPPGRNLVVQLSHGAAAEVPGILVLRVHVLYPGIYLLKVRVADNRLAPQDQLSLEGNLKGQVHERLCIVGDDLPNLAVPSGDRLLQLSAAIGQDDRQAVQLPAQDRRMSLEPVPQRLPALGLVQGKHGALMPLLRQIVHRLIAHAHRRTLGQHDSRLPLQGLQLVIEGIVLPVAHDFPVFGIIRSGSFVQSRHQIFDTFFFFRLHHMLLTTFLSFSFFRFAGPLMTGRQRPQGPPDRSPGKASPCPPDPVRGILRASGRPGSHASHGHASAPAPGSRRRCTSA